MLGTFDLKVFILSQGTQHSIVLPLGFFRDKFIDSSTFLYLMKVLIILIS